MLCLFDSLGNAVLRDGNACSAIGTKTTDPAFRGKATFPSENAVCLDNVRMGRGKIASPDKERRVGFMDTEKSLAVFNRLAAPTVYLLSERIPAPKFRGLRH